MLWVVTGRTAKGLTTALIRTVYTPYRKIRRGCSPTGSIKLYRDGDEHRNPLPFFQNGRGSLTDKPSENVTNAETNNTVDIESLVEISFFAQLYYDQNTRIVYFWNGKSHIAGSATMPSPYYAPNGLPYKYNPETKALEEIEMEKE